MNRRPPLDDEPAHAGGKFALDPSEAQAAKPAPADERELIRDAVYNEPALPREADPRVAAAWLFAKRDETSLAGNVLVTLLAAMIGGPVAIVGVFLAGDQGWGGILYLTLFGPITEELLKLSGIVFLLELKPHRLFSAWQFPFCGLLAGLMFAVFENLTYIYVYFPMMLEPGTDLASFAAFRWLVCTPLHVVCSGIASLGLVRVWRQQCRDGQAAELSLGFPWLFAAMTLHGVYNTVALVSESLPR